MVYIGIIVIAAGRKGSSKSDVSELLEKQSDPLESVFSYDWDLDKTFEKEQQERTQEFSAENTADSGTGQEESAMEDAQKETAGLPDLSSPPSADSLLLPDIGAYIGCSVYESGETRGNSEFLSYRFDIADKAAVEEVIGLLQNGRYQLTLSYSEVVDHSKSSAMMYYSYYFSYTEAASVSEDKNWDDEKYHVFLLINHYFDRGMIGMAYYYVKDFSLEDPGIRGTQVNDVGSSSGGT